MAILKKIIFGILLFWGIGFVYVMPQTMILIDKSGSMEGFFQTGSLNNICSRVNDVIENSAFPGGRLYGFAQSGLQACDQLNQMFPGGNTLIDRALREALEHSSSPELIIIITDNIQDTGGQDTVNDVTLFYDILKEDRVQWVFIFPLKLEFNGWTYHSPQWQGTRASILYAVLLKKDNLSAEAQEKREKELLKVVEQLEKSLPSSGIRCKPLEKGVNISIRKSKKMGKNIDITTGGIKVVYGTFNATPRFSLKLELASKYSNIAVNRAALEGAAVGKIDVSGFFKKVDKDDFKVTIIPDSADIQPGQVDDRYLIDVLCKKLDYDKNLFSLIKMAFGSNGEVSGNLWIKLRIPKQNFQLLPSIIENYGTTDKRDPGRIYGLERLIPVLVEGDEVVIEKPVNFKITIPYPRWTIFILFGLLAIVLLLLFVGFMAYRSFTRCFNLRVNGKEEGQVKFSPLTWTPVQTGEAGTLCRAKLDGKMIAAAPVPCYRWAGEDQGALSVRSFAANDAFTLIDDKDNSFVIELVLAESKENDDKEVTNEEEDGKFFQD